MPAITQEQIDAIDAVVEGMMTDLGVPGTALGVVQNGELVLCLGVRRDRDRHRQSCNTADYFQYGVCRQDVDRKCHHAIGRTRQGRP